MMNEADQASEVLSPDRKELLDRAADQISGELRMHGKVTLNFICTHNSRRSHLAQIWATIGAARRGLSDVECISGGTETTACNPRIVASLRRAGFQIHSENPTSDNPTYQLRFSDQHPTISLSSKRFEDDTKDLQRFIAMMCCSHADETCPNISGASTRIALHYNDPKQSDNTAAEAETYDQRRDEIAAEMLYLMKKAEKTLSGWR